MGGSSKVPENGHFSGHYTIGGTLVEIGSSWNPCFEGIGDPSSDVSKSPFCVFGVRLWRVNPCFFLLARFLKYVF